MKSSQLIRIPGGSSSTARPAVARLNQYPFTSRSTDRVPKQPQRPSRTDSQTGLFFPISQPVDTPQTNQSGGQLPQPVYSPFQMGLILTVARQLDQPGRAAYACYLRGKQVMAIERLHGLRGHNPAVNLNSVLNRIRRNGNVTGVIIATWHHSTSEYPYALEFVEEVERQHDVLLAAGIHLVDNLRMSETGLYSYYGQHNGPYCDAPKSHEQSICRLY